MADLKTAEYTRKAIDNYNEKFDRCMVNLPKGTKEKIKTLTGLSFNKFASDIILAELEKLEIENDLPF